MTFIGQHTMPARIQRGRPVTRRQRWMLLLAFEVLVFGFMQASLNPVRRPGVTVEKPVIPNHVIT